MGWKTDNDSVKVVSRESVEDRDPELYVKRAKEYTKKKMYKEAEKEYDKAIEYSGKKWSFYWDKMCFYMEIGEKEKERRLFIRILVTKLSFMCFYGLALLAAMVGIFDYRDFGMNCIYLGNLALGIKMVEIIVKKYKIKWQKYVIRAFILLSGILSSAVFGLDESIWTAILWIYVLKLVYEKLRSMHSIRADILIGAIFLGITCALAWGSVDNGEVLIIFIYVSESIYEMLRDMRRYFLSQKAHADEFADESDFKDSEFQETSMDGVSFEDIQYPKEEHQPDKVSQQEDIQSCQETPQREPSFMSANEGMLLVLDVPIQKGKVSIDKVIVTKDMVKLPINGKNIQIDVFCKKFEVIQDIDFEHFKRYDIKKGSLVYVLVAMVEYCINIWSKEWDDNTESACEKLTIQLNQKLNPYDIRTRLSKKGWQFLENNVLITFEDVLYLLNSKRV